MKKIALFLCFTAATFLYSQSARTDAGVVDFSSENLVLKSGWEFYWNKFLSPDQLDDSSSIQPDLITNAGAWNDLEIGGKKCGSYGFATYRTTVYNLPQQALMMNAHSVQTSMRLFLNGTLVAEVGKPDTNASSSKPMNRDVQVTIPPHQGELEIIVHIANFHHRKGGFVNAFEIGSADKIILDQTRFYLLDAIESAALAIIGFFLLALYVFRRKDMAALYFSLFCLTLSLRPIISVNYLLATLFPDLSWNVMLKLEYLGVLFPCLFLVLFIRKLFPQQLPIYLVRIFAFIFAFKIGITLFFTPFVFSWLVPALLLIIPIGIAVMTIVIVRAVIAKADGANYAGLGVIVLFISLLLKVMTYAGILPPLHVLITMLDIGFIFMMSLILGSRFSLQFVKAETLQAETEKQRVDIEQKKEQIEHQKELVEEKNKEIVDSINYAKRIQAAILPARRMMEEKMPEHLLFYKPKDIVAGDFYWLEERRNSVLFAVADCTGHGVPGALVSVICHSGLNRSVREFDLIDPGKILDKTREIIVSEFEKSDDEVKDGMDISLVAFDRSSKKLRWAGANNPLWILRNETSQVEIVKPNKQPIGKFANIQPFTTHEIDLKSGDLVYLFTDGFADQFGGDKGKKLKYDRLRDLLVSISSIPFESQLKRLESELESWKGSLEQTDDICLVIIRF